MSCPTKGDKLALRRSDDDIENSLIVMEGEVEPQEQQELLRKLKISWRA